MILSLRAHPPRPQRSGVSSAVYPIPLQLGEETRTYEFKETLTVATQLFRVSSPLPRRALFSPARRVLST